MRRRYTLVGTLASKNSSRRSIANREVIQMGNLLVPLVSLALLGVCAGAGCVAFRLGKTMVLDVLANADPMPAWLEAVMPLKGRWLRLLLAAPGIAVFVVVAFTMVIYAVMIIVAALLAAAWFIAGVINRGVGYW